MSQQQALDAQARARSLLQAKWFPGAIASLALVIAIGGHAFTAFNSVGYATMANKIDSIQASLITTARVDRNQDVAVQALQADLAKALRQNQAMHSDIEQLKQYQAEHKAEIRKVADAQEAQEAQIQAEHTKAEQRLKKTGVNERFDALIRTRMKPHWEAPVRAPGAEPVKDNVVAVIEFTVDRQGQVTDVQVATTSGEADFDASAVKAGERMAVIPEIPRLNDLAYSQIKVFRLSVTPAAFK